MPTVCKITLDSSQYRKELDKVVTESRSSAGQLAKTTAASTDTTEKAATGIRGVWQEMTSLHGGAKKLVESILAGGGAIGIIVAGVQGFCKAVSAVYNLMTASSKEAIDQAARNAESIRETAAANEELRQKSDGYLSQLSQLSSREKLSNAEKANASKLIRDLPRDYGDMGISIDEVTGKIIGLDAAMVKKAQRDKAFRLAEINREMKDLQYEKSLQEENRDKAGFRVPFTSWQIGGAEKAEKAQQRISELDKRMAELRKQQREVSGADAAGDLLRKARAEKHDLQRTNRDQLRDFEGRKSDDELSALKTAEEKIANRQKKLEKLRREILAPLEKKTAATETWLQSTTGIENEEAWKHVLQIEHEVQSAREKEYEIERQIAELKRQKTEQVRKLLENSAYELQYSEAIADKDYDRAAALKLEKQLREQNLTLTRAQQDALLTQEKLRKSQDLRNSLGDQAFDLFGKAMTAAGNGRDFEELAALRSAKSKKGGDLTEEEKSMVLSLTALQRELSGVRSASPGDLSIRTNSLTARGGFSSGAVVPDGQDYNRMIASSSKRQEDLLRRICDIVNTLGAY